MAVISCKTAAIAPPTTKVG